MHFLARLNLKTLLFPLFFSMFLSPTKIEAMEILSYLSVPTITVAFQKLVEHGRDIPSMIGSGFRACKDCCYAYQHPFKSFSEENIDDNALAKSVTRAGEILHDIIKAKKTDSKTPKPLQELYKEIIEDDRFVYELPNLSVDFIKAKSHVSKLKTQKSATEATPLSPKTSSGRTFEVDEKQKEKEVEKKTKLQDVSIQVLSGSSSSSSSSSSIPSLAIAPSKSRSESRLKKRVSEMLSLSMSGDGEAEEKEKTLSITDSGKALALLQGELSSLLGEVYSREIKGICKKLSESRSFLNNIVFRKKKNINEFEMDIGKMVFVNENKPEDGVGFLDTLHVRLEFRKKIPSAM